MEQLIKHLELALQTDGTYKALHDLTARVDDGDLMFENKYGFRCWVTVHMVNWPLDRAYRTILKMIERNQKVNRITDKNGIPLL